MAFGEGEKGRGNCCSREGKKKRSVSRLEKFMSCIRCSIHHVHVGGMREREREEEEEIHNAGSGLLLIRRERKKKVSKRRNRKANQPSHELPWFCNMYHIMPYMMRRKESNQLIIVILGGDGVVFSVVCEKKVERFLIRFF